MRVRVDEGSDDDSGGVGRDFSGGLILRGRFTFAFIVSNLGDVGGRGRYSTSSLRTSNACGTKFGPTLIHFVNKEADFPINCQQPSKARLCLQSLFQLGRRYMNKPRVKRFWNILLRAPIYKRTKRNRIKDYLHTTTTNSESERNKYPTTGLTELLVYTITGQQS